ncbi:MAG: hypothetical protein R3B67_00655 [Phycisphaerales bacterium]
MPTHWVNATTDTALDAMLQHAGRVGLMNTEEFTFRSMFMRAAEQPGIRFQTEWNKFDLLAQIDTEFTLIEFKYYITRRTQSLDGKPGNYKGGASKQNEDEFWRCVNKLATQAPSQIAERFLVLVYEREYPKRSRFSFHNSYGDITAKPPVSEVWAITRGPLEARILRVEPA